MRRGLTIAGLVLGIGLGLLWATGGLSAAETWLTATQRAAQERLAGAVRAIRAGEAGAMTSLVLLSFGYGLAHAAGPGHGKVLIGGYGVARRVAMAPLAGLALAAALAQAAVAVALVYAAVGMLGWTRDRLLGGAETVMAPLGQAMIAALGLWLMWRGWRGLRGQGPHNHHPHDHHHDHDDGCGCGHAHGPTLAQVQAAPGWRDRAALVAGIAMRPCTGALFLLILTWQLGIGAAGVIGTFAMAMGTAAVTIAAAALAVWAREGALATLSGRGLARALPVAEIVAGGAIVIVAVMLSAGLA